MRASVADLLPALRARPAGRDARGRRRRIARPRPASHEHAIRHGSRAAASPPGKPHRLQVPDATHVREVPREQLAAPDRAVRRRGRHRRRSPRPRGPSSPCSASTAARWAWWCCTAISSHALALRAHNPSRGSRGAGRGRPPPARPRTALRSGRSPRGSERSVSQLLRSPMWGPTHARSPLARQNVLFSSAPQASSGGTGAGSGEAPRDLAAGAPDDGAGARRRRGAAVRVVASRRAPSIRSTESSARAVDRAVVDEEQRRRPGRAARARRRPRRRSARR